MRVRRFLLLTGSVGLMLVLVMMAPAVAGAQEAGSGEMNSSPTASLTITKAAEPLAGEVAPRFSFGGTLGGFTLADGESVTFAELAPGDYTVSEILPAGWVLDGITCQGVEPMVSGLAVTVTLQQGQPAACTFTSHQERVAGPELPTTGPATFVIPLLVAGLWAMLIGLALALWPSTRRVDLS